MRVITYQTHRQGGEALHPYLRRFESSVLEGQAVFRVCQQLREEVDSGLDPEPCWFRQWLVFE